LKEIALHLLDIAENSASAGASVVDIQVAEDIDNDRLRLVIQDNGKGMDADLLARVTDPFVTSRTTRKVGLGIPLLKAAAEACNGHMQINSQVGQGTRLEIDFQRSNIDRMPLGDLAGTMLTLIVGFPAIRWKLDYRVADRAYTFDSGPIQDELGDVPLTTPSILAFIRGILEEGISKVQKTAGASQADCSKSSTSIA
jgi:anti-sigma regulatory factor (Ser/Thr protein kinase)